MSKTLEFYFDVGSPAAYLASTQIPRIAAEAGAAIAWRPMLLGAVFQATGNRSPADVPAKKAYIFRDFQRHAERYGVPYRDNPHFPINTLALMRGAAGFQLREPALFGRYVEAVFRAIWAEQQNMNDAAVVAAVLEKAGLPAARFAELIADQAVKDTLRAATEAAVARGVFGAPTMFVGEIGRAHV